MKKERIRNIIFRILDDENFEIFKKIGIVIYLVFGKGVDTPYSWIVCISAFFINFFAVGSSFLVTGTLSSYWRNELCAFDNRSCTGKWTTGRMFKVDGHAEWLVWQKLCQSIRDYEMPCLILNFIIENRRLLQKF